MTPEERERGELLERLRVYMHEHGLAGLNLAAVAQWLGRPEREVRQFFVDDDDLMLALVAQSRVRLREKFLALTNEEGAVDLRTIRRNMWNAYVDSVDDQVLFFEAFGLAMHDSHYRAFVHGINDWLDLIAHSMIERGIAAGKANAFATLVVGVYRGAMLDYCLTRDRARISAAMEVWFDIADTIDDWLTEK